MARERITGRQKDVAKMLRDRKAGSAGKAGSAKKAVRTTAKATGAETAGGDLLSVALRNERSERAFYLRNAERTRNRIAKAMFRRIADDELEHYRLLNRILKGSKENKSGDLPGEAATRVKEVLKEQILDAMKAPKTAASDLDAIRTAIDFEAKGASRYAELRDRAADPVAKRLFDLLASVEHEHFLALRELEELMTDPASWYRWRERHGLDGG